MKTGFKFLSALITATTLISPIAFAADDTAPAAEEIHNRVAYGTPTIDGKLDDMYLKSERIDYKLKPWYLMDEKDAEARPELINWDTGIEAYSYMLWDDDNIYVYFSVKDNTLGIVDYEKAEFGSHLISVIRFLCLQIAAADFLRRPLKAIPPLFCRLTATPAKKARGL